MSYDIALHVPSPGLDPRNDAAVEAWLQAKPAADISIERWRALEVAVIGNGGQLTGTRRRWMIKTDEGNWHLESLGSGGYLEGRFCDESWEMICVVCDALGWVAWDPQERRIMYGIDLVCGDCRSAIEPSKDACGVCGADLADAHLSR